MISPLRVFLVLLFLQAVALFAQSASPADDVTILSVNGEPVSAGEYTLVMRRQTALVYAHFKRTRDLDDHAGYWSPDSGPDGPLAKLRELTRAELVRIKIFQSEARSRGLMKNIDFASYRRALEKENTRRVAAKAAGEVVYGPPRYRPDAYYYILFRDVAYKLEHAMAKELEAAVTPAEIDAFVADHAEAFKPLPAEDVRRRATEELALRAAQKKLQDLVASAAIVTNPEALARMTPRAD